MKNRGKRESKSVHVTFTIRHGNCPLVKRNNADISQADHVRYLCLHLNRRLTWKNHTFTKRKQLGLQLRKIYWMLNVKSHLSIDNKLLLYKSILKSSEHMRFNSGERLPIQISR